ncbi:glycosyltransferase [Polaribacter sp. SA4-12]|uniref:glycosyltransferase n=1 Tax=Polaribacter sp. SA4-12 TaxID=1312072 RepID=UPI000B3D226E|nr:glycosyltransferase [Polaribacter sp. SA4-12]ARV16847.1 glycosyl transferase family 1 [Polaribacter sp. SA4-12]
MKEKTKSKIVFLSTIPPTECGIATFTTDLVTAISKGFNDSIEPLLCDLTSNPKSNNGHFNLNPKEKSEYSKVAEEINKDPLIKLVHIQHEFGLFGGKYGSYLLYFLETIKKPVVLTFHSVIPNPDLDIKSFVQVLSSYVDSIFVMTKKSQNILIEDYLIQENMITYIPHGTHIVNYAEPRDIKKKFNLENRTLLSTFGLLGPGKCIETAINALPEIIKHTPNLLYLIIGKTHPNTIENNIDNYRDYLKCLVVSNKLDNHVLFIDRYLEINELLEYLKATDIYLFTSKDPNQAVSGTFTYAMSCACPMVATSIPHTREVLTSDSGILIDIENSKQLAEAVEKILSNDDLRNSMAINAFQKTRESSWENIAVKHLNSYKKHIDKLEEVQFKYPYINLDHIKRLTTTLGIIQFSKINKPDITSGYTLDDNARALIAMSMNYQLYKNKEDLLYLNVYLNFIERCQQESGNFTNYIDENNHEHIQNSYVNLEDSNARAVWALGYVISLKEDLPKSIINKATICLLKCSQWVPNLLSPRAIGFAIKGLYFYYVGTKDKYVISIIEKLAKNLITNYDINAIKDWKWFENYMTYANSILPEAMLYTYLLTGKKKYKNVAIESFDFLLSKIFINGNFKAISNNGWYQKEIEPNQFGEQPIDVSYTIQTLNIFYKTFQRDDYRSKMEIAFSWFLGKNQLSQIMYNPITGGCYDGLEKTHVNLNQGAESTVCYLTARLVMEQNSISEQREIIKRQKQVVLQLLGNKRDEKYRKIAQN